MSTRSAVARRTHNPVHFVTVILNPLTFPQFFEGNPIMQFALRLGALAAAGAMCLAASGSDAAEIWSVQDGQTSLLFNTELMNELGLTVTGVEETPTGAVVLMDPDAPAWHFQMTPASDFSFEVEKGAFHATGPLSGHLAHLGTFSIRNNATGEVFAFRDFDVVPATQQTAIGPTTIFQLSEVGAAPLFDLVHGGIVYDRDSETMRVIGFDIQINSEFAQRLGRPELDGQFIGAGETMANVLWTDGAYAGENPGPNPEGTCDFRDVALGILSDISYINRDGVYPTGVVGLAMATTSCNLGNCDVEWHAPMQEDHPGIAMHLYRETAGVLEQIGVSDIKHGFFALSSSQCTPCQNPSNGSFLGVGCSDTYGVGNNSDRNWLAPRDEWQAYPGTWTCNGSHFSGGQNDCVRRHGSSGHGPTDHRLQVTDAELDIAGNYFFEGLYVVRGDQNRINNYGWRPCTFNRSGNSYNFSDGSGFPVIEGPKILTWGDMQSWGEFPGNGQIIVSSKVTSMPGNLWAYEYAILNFDSDIDVQSFSVPVGTSTISNIGFHDPNLNDLDSWDATVADGKITWTTTANVITYGEMYNFRFTSDAEPADGVADATGTGPGSPVISVDARIPGFDPASVGELAGAAGLQLRNAPNPLSASTTISFQLSETAETSLDIYDASGRQVRSLVSGDLAAGTHSFEWNGTRADGVKVPSGVYYYRLRAGQLQDVRSLRVLN